MSYRAPLLASAELPYLPPSLRRHLEEPAAVDPPIKYTYPVPIDDRSSHLPKPRLRPGKFTITLPARLAYPLIPYPQEIKQFFSTGSESSLDYVHNHHYHQVKALAAMRENLRVSEYIRDAPISFDINSLKRMSVLPYTKRQNVVHTAALSCARRMTDSELGLVAMEPVTYDAPCPDPSPSLGFLTVIQKLRALLTSKNPEDQNASLDLDTTLTEPELRVFDDNSYLYYASCTEYSFFILVAGNHFMIYHSDAAEWFIGPRSYLDYMVTVADTTNNVVMISRTKDYAWAKEVLEILVETIHYDAPHNTVVSFMKNFEAIMLTSSDYDSKYAINWSPVLDTLYDSWLLSKTIDKSEIGFGAIVQCFCGRRQAGFSTSLLGKLLVALHSLNGNQKQELSSLHKFIYYAEVDAKKGLEKFLGRVHTKRSVDPQENKNIVRLFKREFFFSYVGRHNSLPQFEADPKTRAVIEAEYSRKRLNELKEQSLNFWDKVRLFNCLDNTLTDDPLEFSKDKGALRESIRYGPGDSRKELLQVVETEDYKLSSLSTQFPFQPQHQEVLHTRSKESAEPCKNPTRLIEKEREQKIEARVFGNSTLKNKHGLSMMMSRAKKALSYIPHQMMTPADSKRKSMLHDAAQEISDEHTYALLLDIEGHNQSMQSDNTSELLESIGHLFGENGWGELARYFSAQEVFHYDEYLDEVMISRGQLGGIEGWYNPVWTLHTTLMMMLLNHTGDVDMKNLLVYSDDVAGIFKMQSSGEGELSALFAKITRHCSKFGMIAKITQTNLSKNRVTLLRQHYWCGKRSDATLKTMMAISGLSNTQVFSEELEVAAISSSAASALELSEHTDAICYLKNYKLALLLYRLVHRVIRSPEQYSMFDVKELPSEIVSLLYGVTNHTTNQNLTDTEFLQVCLDNEMVRFNKVYPGVLNQLSIERLALVLHGNNPASQKFLENADRVIYLLTQNKFLQDLLFFLIYLPASLGGMGGSLHINLMLSGHSEGLSKSTYYLRQWIEQHSSFPTYFRRFLALSMSIPEEQYEGMNESSLLSSTWPTNLQTKTASTLISVQITRLMTKIAKNKGVIALLDLNDEIKEIAKALIDIFRNNFHHRVAQFYFENSAKHFLDLLIRKVETSSSLISEVQNISALRFALARRAELNIRNAARATGKIVMQLGKEDDLIETMISYRSAMYPKIKFIEVEEPLYDHRLNESYGTNWIVRIMHGGNMHYRDGLKIYNRPHYGNETLYKGEALDDDRMIGQKEEFLAAKVVAITKWLLVKGGITDEISNKDSTIDCIQACNITLHSICGKTLAELAPYAPHESGGEILHRIPNMKFNQSTYLRSEPHRSTLERSELNQTVIMDLKLTDSNVNFDYMRMRLILAHTHLNKSDRTRIFMRRYQLTTLTGIHDVQFVTPKQADRIEDPVTFIYSTSHGHLFGDYRLRYISMFYMTTEDLSHATLINTHQDEETLARTQQDLVDQQIYSYYRSLNREYMISSPVNINQDTWAPLVEYLIKINPKFKDEDDEFFINMIRSALKKKIEEFNGGITIRSASDTLQQLRRLLLTELTEDEDRGNEVDILCDEIRRLQMLERILSKADVPEEKVRAVLRRLDRNKARFIVQACCEMIVKYFLHAEYANAKATMNVRRSVQHFFESIEDLEAVLDSDDRLLLSYLIASPVIFVNEARKMRGAIVDILNKKADGFSVFDILPVERQILAKTEVLPFDVYTPTAQNEACGYALVDVPPNYVADLEVLRGPIDFARSMVELFAHPMMQESPTGSASYISQLALFRTLLKSELMTPDMTICDLTAGRGDGLFAGEYLGLNMSSYSRLDAYTQIRRHPRVRIDRDYDLKRTETVAFIRDFAWVHIDASFTGETKPRLQDLIATCEEFGVAYSIRLNSLDLEFVNDSNYDFNNGYSRKLAFSNTGANRAYQIYLVGRYDGTVHVSPTVDIKQSGLFRELVTSFVRLYDRRNLYLYSTDHYPTSYTIDIPHDEYLISTIDNIITDSISESVRSNVRKLVRFLDDHGGFWISPNHIIPRNMYLLDIIMPDAAVQTGPVYLEVDRSEIVHDNERREIGLKQHLDALHDPNEEKICAVMGKSFVNYLELIRLDSPVKAARSAAITFKFLIENGVLQANDGLEQMQAVITGTRTSTERLMNGYQREFRDALNFLLLAAERGDRRYGLNVLYIKWRSEPEKRKSFTRQIQIYKVLCQWYDAIHDSMMSGGPLRQHIGALERKMISSQVYKYQEKVKMIESNSAGIRDEAKDVISVALMGNDFNTMFTGTNFNILGDDNEMEPERMETDPLLDELADVSEQLGELTDGALGLGSLADRINKYFEQANDAFDDDDYYYEGYDDDQQSPPDDWADDDPD